MKILKPVENIPTELILKSLENGFVVFFCLGFFGGAFLVIFSTSGFSEHSKTYAVAISVILLLLFLLFYSYYTRARIIPELKRRLNKFE